MMRIIFVLLFAVLPFAAQRPPGKYVLVRNGAPAAPAITITSENIPAHGADQSLYNSRNVFDLTAASTYSDGSMGDWVHDATTAADPAFTHNQNITLRKTPAVPRISGFTYLGTGVGPSISIFFLNSFFGWSMADNDFTGVDFTGPLYNAIGDGLDHVRVLGSDAVGVQCTGAGSALIAGCGQQWTVTTPKAGPQNIYVYTRTQGIDARLTVMQGGTITNFDLPTATGYSVDEEQITVAVNAPAIGTVYTISLTAQAVQSGTTTGYISTMARAIGGATAGNVSAAVLATPSYYGGAPSRTYGAKVLQADPSVRIPAATTSVTLCLTAGNPSGCVNDTLAHYIAVVAVGGTDIHLPLGFISNNQIVLPNRDENGWVRVIADGAPSLTFGQRAFPKDYPHDAASPARLSFSGGNTAVITNDYANSSMTARAAHHYAFVGCEISTIPTTYDNTFTMVTFSPGTSATPAAMPHDLIFSGVYVHKDAGMLNVANGFQMDANAWAIYDSDISNIAAPGFSNESHAIYWNTSAGPVTLVNNHFSAATEDVLPGGDSSQPLLVTRNIEIRGNYFDKDPAWNTQPYPSGIDVKNELEFKEGQDVTVTGNMFRHSYAGAGQKGQAIFIRSTTFGGSILRSTSGYDIHDNIIEDSSDGIMLEGADYYGLGTPGSYDARIPRHYSAQQYDIRVTNNLLRNMSFVKYGASGHGQDYLGCIVTGSLATNVTINSNSCQWDSATDNAYFGRGQRRDASFLIQSLATIGQPEADLGSAGSCTPLVRPVYDEAITSLNVNNNILSGDILGDCTGGAPLLPSRMQSFTNNTFFNAKNINLGPAYGYSPSLNGAGNTYTSSTTMPVVAGRGVNYATLPSACALITGNRSDVTCDETNGARP
ncbi:MAG: hypothetical protein M3Z09_01375 [Acidobacteriota bacterium]|nr:hypothetical protein [Acidobacteriota bacterium]